jgi:hypothetical protein
MEHTDKPAMAGLEKRTITAGWKLRPSAAACALTISCLLILMMGPFMHEADQASLLRGGVDIATGQWRVARGAYNFDKQFVSYVLLASTIKMLPTPLSPDAIVMLGNLVSFTIFWGALYWLLARLHRTLPLALVLPLILAPAVVEHSPFLGTAFISAAFLFLLLGLMECQVSNGFRKHLRRFAMFVLVFCAVGARGDAVLVLPLLAILGRRQRSMSAVMKSAETWIMAVAAGAALVLGRALFLGSPYDFIEPFLNLPVFMAYTFFGLGGAGLLLLVCLGAIASGWRKRRFRLWSMMLAGALVLPLLYYGIQLESTRYFILGVVGLFAFVYSTHGGAICRLWLHRKSWRRSLKAALLVFAVAPLLVGVHFRSPRHPRLTVTDPTRFPTADGVLPMGAYLTHAIRVRKQNGFVDHNQAIWEAAAATEFEKNDLGRVPVLNTPMVSYILLAARLQDKVAQIFTLPEQKVPPVFYVDSRSLMRRPANPMGGAPEGLSGAFLSLVSLRQASPYDRQGITVCRGSLRPDKNSLSPLLWIFNQAFEGNEFRLIEKLVPPGNAAVLYPIRGEMAEKQVVLVSYDRFQCVTVTNGQSADLETRQVTHQTLGRFFVCSIDPAVADVGVRIRFERHGVVWFAASVFPPWMSVRKL